MTCQILVNNGFKFHLTDNWKRLLILAKKCTRYFTLLVRENVIKNYKKKNEKQNRKFKLFYYLTQQLVEKALNLYFFKRQFKGKWVKRNLDPVQS